MRVLDLGAGGAENSSLLWPEAEIVTVDLNPEAEPDVVADVCDLPEDLGLFGHILASHVLEHLSRAAIVPALQHWMEYLAPGGTLHVLVPDLDWAAEQLCYLPPPPSLAVIAHIYGAQGSEWDFHRSGFTALLLRGVLGAAGYLVTYLRLGPYGITFPDTERVEARQIYARAKRKEELHAATNGETRQLCSGDDRD